MNISFLCGSAWKWLLGPIGLGYLYISKNFLEEVRPVFHGTDSVINSEEYLPYKVQLKPGADRFSYSSMSFLDLIYFYHSLEFLQKITLHKALERIHHLSKLLRNQLIQQGLRVFGGDSEFSYNSGIVVIKDRINDPKKLFAELKKLKIVCALRDGRVRFSTHIMNTEQHIKYTAEAMGKLIV